MERRCEQWTQSCTRGPQLICALQPRFGRLRGSRKWRLSRDCPYLSCIRLIAGWKMHTTSKAVTHRLGWDCLGCDVCRLADFAYAWFGVPPCSRTAFASPPRSKPLGEEDHIMICPLRTHTSFGHAHIIPVPSRNLAQCRTQPPGASSNKSAESAPCAIAMSVRSGALIGSADCFRRTSELRHEPSIGQHGIASVVQSNPVVNGFTKGSSRQTHSTFTMEMHR